MKISDAVNSWGPTIAGVMMAVAAILLWEKKHELPDHYEPITVEEADEKIEPLLFAAKIGVYNAAIRNIPYNWDQRCFPPQGMNLTQGRAWDKTYRVKNEEEYKNHIWATEEAHEYEGLTKTEVCNLRILKKIQE